MRSPLSREEKESLRLLAREAIFHGLERGTPMTRGEMENLISLTSSLREERGAFVTLTIEGDLRGCIGYPLPILPLYEAVGENAYHAAFDDPRFPSLSKEESQRADIEISALTPMEVVRDVESIIVGTHGLMIKNGAMSGLLLPQVAVEYGWDRETFLTHTCRKAGLSPSAWRDPSSQIFSFQADLF